MTTPLLYSDTIEEVPADESADIARLLVTVEMLIRFHLEWSGRRQREVHVKSHGSAHGEFRVSADLPPELSQGIFARPQTYSARVRFSSSAPWSQPDIVPDGRGLAIQLTEVEGESLERHGLQDFVMVNNPTFLARNVKDYLKLQEERLRAGPSRLRQGVRLLGHLITPSQWPGLGAAIRTATQFPLHPAAYTYFSMVPFRFGQFVAKYRVRPIHERFGSPPVAAARFLTDRNAMRQLLTDSLAREELGFEFQIQLRTSQASMPIEDATVEWPEAESPYRTVATLHLPRQIVLSGEEASSEEHRSFDVWNGLVHHRPLGGINRARRLAYPASARFREAH